MKPRELNKLEVEALQSLFNKGKLHKSVIPKKDSVIPKKDRLLVQYVNRDGGFNICLVREIDNDSTIMWVGVSRRSNRDKPNRVRGNMLAFIRAITNSPVER